MKNQKKTKTMFLPAVLLASCVFAVPVIVEDHQSGAQKFGASQATSNRAKRETRDSVAEMQKLDMLEKSYYELYMSYLMQRRDVSEFDMGMIRAYRATQEETQAMQANQAFAITLSATSPRLIDSPESSRKRVHVIEQDSIKQMKPNGVGPTSF